MPMYNANIIIKELRQASGLTQEQLAEGICSRSTVNMVERGKRKPDWFTFRNLLLKLGVNPEIYYNDIASEEDVYINNKYEECDKLVTAWEYESLKNEVEKMEQDTRFSKGQGYWVYLKMKASLYLQGAYQDNMLALECLYEQMRILRPNFELNKIPDYHLSIDDIIVLNNIAISLSYSEGHEKCIEVFKMLQTAFENDYEKNFSSESLDRHYHANLHNLCLIYKHSGMYDECVTTADKGMALYKGDRNTLQQAWYMYFKAFSLMKLGNKNEGELLYKKFLFYTHIFNGYCVDDSWHKEEFEKEFGYSLNLSIPW